MAGTAPTDVAWLFVEYAGPWGQQAVADSRLPAELRELLADLTGVRVQLIRRHGGVSGPGVRVFAAWLGEQPAVWSGVLDDHAGLLDLDLAGLARGGDAGLAPYDEPLLLVCTNGRRDVCCAELGRPIAAALAARWPEATWETTHLGGHRFAGTLLALPSGVTLGRLDVASAVDDCTALAARTVPGRTGTGSCRPHTRGPGRRAAPADGARPRRAGRGPGGTARRRPGPAHCRRHRLLRHGAEVRGGAAPAELFRPGHQAGRRVRGDVLG